MSLIFLKHVNKYLYMLHNNPGEASCVKNIYKTGRQFYIGISHGQDGIHWEMFHFSQNKPKKKTIIYYIRMVSNMLNRGW